jgi:glutamate-ammonia-ligase adenylyltransferase
MHSAFRIPNADRLPLPGDEERVELEFDKLAVGPAVLRRLAREQDGRALLAAIFGSSPFLSQLLHSESDILEEFLTQDSTAVLAHLIQALVVECSPHSDTSRIMRALRRARRRAALLVGLADIGGQWGLEQITGALSDFADFD